MPTAVSAPGKVLLAGGYLVLDRNYTGLVFGLNARIHCVIDDSPEDDFVVRSPQFKEAVWKYKRNGEALVASAGPKNPFVETALAYALAYVGQQTQQAQELKPCQITIIADSDYYSQSGAPVKTSTSMLWFKDFGVPLSQVNKTGLGSSAALVTSLTAAVLSHYTSEPLATDTGRRRLHNLAQAAHCAAQGKVGSGFDIAAAVYGSCIYKRFSPSCLEGLGEANEAGFTSRLQALVNDQSSTHRMDHVIDSNPKIPQDLLLVMCDVDCGSQTPGMVKQVLKWRSEKQEEADWLWNGLQRQNESLADRLADFDGCDSMSVDRGDFDLVKEQIRAIRVTLRKMSQLAGVPIEPPEQTRLLDAISKLPGVVGGVVPGAGGYDAAALLVGTHPDILQRIKQMLAGWTFSMEPDKQGGTVRLLDVRGEMEGIRAEELSLYAGWL